jgi:cyanophycinase
MTGPIGLHGGGEYLAGDEPFLDALIAAASRVADVRAGSRAADEDRRGDDVSGHAVEESVATIRIVIVPTAAARGRPDAAASTGRVAFERRGSAAGRPVEVEVARIIDVAGAADAGHARRLAEADLIHLPGGDPDLIPSILGASPALAAIEMAWRRGAVVAGSSAGAMALAEWTWTPSGGVRGLAFVHGLAVVPHYDDVRRTRWQQGLDQLAPGGIGYLGLDEKTGVIAVPNGADGRDWRVAGPGAAHWFARGAAEPLVGRDGDTLSLPF